MAGPETDNKKRSHRKEAVHVIEGSPKQKVEISVFQLQAASHLPPFPAQASHPGKPYHQPIALSSVFSRRDSTVSGACYQVESRRSLGEAA
jgi:hypothetical protein